MICREVYYKQPSAGEASWNTYGDLRGKIIQFAVNPSVNTTTYIMTLTDDTGTQIYKRSHKGISRDDTNVGVYGIYTVGISSASVSTNSFTVTLMWREIMTP